MASSSSQQKLKKRKYYRDIALVRIDEKNIKNKISLVLTGKWMRKKYILKKTKKEEENSQILLESILESEGESDQESSSDKEDSDHSTSFGNFNSSKDKKISKISSEVNYF